MISLTSLPADAEPETDQDLTGAVAANPSCYSVTIFTQRWKEVRDFYVDILNARVLSERTDRYCEMDLGGIPLTVQYSFKIGAVVFLIAVLWTVLTTKEYPPEDIEAFERNRHYRRGRLLRRCRFYEARQSAIARRTCDGRAGGTQSNVITDQSRRRPPLSAELGARRSNNGQSF